MTTLHAPEGVPAGTLLECRGHEDVESIGTMSTVRLYTVQFDGTVRDVLPEDVASLVAQGCRPALATLRQ